MSRFWLVLIVVITAIGLLGPSNLAYGQLGGLKKKVKEKVEDKVDQKTDEKIDEAVDKAAGDAPEEEEAKEEKTEESKEGEQKATATAGEAAPQDMTLYTKYDFVPGDKVIFFDDFSSDEVGEFPHRWNLDNGIFEVAKKGEDFVVLSSQSGLGTVRPKIAEGPLPPKYTVEFDFYIGSYDEFYQWYEFYWVGADGEDIAKFEYNVIGSTLLSIQAETKATKNLGEPYTNVGLHTIRIMATKNSIKIYYDNDRVANVPKTEDFAPVGFRLGANVSEEEYPVVFSSFRYAEGGKTLKDQLDADGKIITHGILFDSGSDKIKGESYKTLADIGQLLTENRALRLSIEGHTDSDGADDYNAKLSQGRANSVKTYLVETYKITSDRLETKGWGESKPIDNNNTPEGKANNRRVELVKL
jgi:outer membrane protein OmpA-like peptidoglycan-associated protein/Sec-independent protein translocase protein TatA